MLTYSSASAVLTSLSLICTYPYFHQLIPIRKMWMTGFSLPNWFVIPNLLPTIEHGKPPMLTTSPHKTYLNTVRASPFWLTRCSFSKRIAHQNSVCIPAVPNLHDMFNPPLLTPWCRVLLEKLTGLQLVKKFPTFHRTQRFITALTSVHHLSLSWASPYTHIPSPGDPSQHYPPIYA